ncbi:MAG TPA: hypothetical protein VFJ14_09680 [Nocardioidaceae bacterium]|nr:hypothetical protein [Nocardioidaceae bacterium]
MKVGAGNVSACRSCGRTDTEFEVVSEHRTARGAVGYVRCSCGALQVLSRSRLDSTQRVVVGAPHIASAGAGTSVA